MGVMGRRGREQGQVGREEVHAAAGGAPGGEARPEPLVLRLRDEALQVAPREHHAGVARGELVLGRGVAPAQIVC